MLFILKILFKRIFILKVAAPQLTTALYFCTCPTMAEAAPSLPPASTKKLKPKRNTSYPMKVEPAKGPPPPEPGTFFTRFYYA